MIVGLLSDTHDKLPAMKAGVKALLAGGAEYLIHCGDVGGEAILDQLAGREAAFVWGNNDWDRAGLEAYATSLGLHCLGHGGAIELAGKSLFVTHGDDGRLIHSIVDGQKHDYLLTGHTHVPHDHRHGRMRAINPGALYRANPKTVALLDLKRDELTFLEVPI